MPEYRFRICRNVTESAEVTIMANSIEEAQEAANLSDIAVCDIVNELLPATEKE